MHTLEIDDLKPWHREYLAQFLTSTTDHEVTVTELNRVRADPRARRTQGVEGDREWIHPGTNKSPRPNGRGLFLYSQALGISS